MKRNSHLSGYILQRAIDLDDFLERHRVAFNRDQRISTIRLALIQENARGYQRGVNAARKAEK